MFVGVNMTFFPIHFLGIAGMPRRYCDYPDRYYFWNMVRSVGSLVSFIRVLIFLRILHERYVSKRPIIMRWLNRANLEVCLSYPPTEHNYPRTPSLYLK